MHYIAMDDVEDTILTKEEFFVLIVFKNSLLKKSKTVLGDINYLERYNPSLQKLYNPIQGAAII